LRLTSKYHRYGYAAVGFGDPLSLTAFMKDPHEDSAAQLGQALMDRIAAVMPITPVPLVAHTLADGVTTMPELTTRIRQRIEGARARGAAVHIPRDDIDYTIEAGLRALIERKVLSRDGDQLTLNKDSGDLLRFYAASVAHLLGDTGTSPQSDSAASPRAAQ